jgi:molybdopterin molybdotransferase
MTPTTPLISVDEALQRVLDSVTPLPSEEVPVASAHGRVLAAPLASRRTQPGADLSAMDGYAARAADLAASATLKLVGASAAGRPYAGSLKPGETVRIFTGALLPAGADTVIPQEDAKTEGDRVALPASKPGQYVRRKGLDFSEGQVLLEAGRRVSARDISLIAAMDYGTVPVAHRPRVAILATGDELVPPGSGAGPERTVASNPLSLAALLRSEGAETVDLGVAPDNLDAIAATIRKARGAGNDVLVTLGGASVGEHDLVARALRAEGIAIDFHRVALRPGRPMLLGFAGAMRVLGLPGNPVSSFVCAVLFLVPLLRKLQGRRDFLPETEPAIVGRALPANDHRQDYLRARIERGADGRLMATALDRQDSSMIAYLAGANGLLIRPPHAPAAQAGDACQVIRFTD